MPILVKLSVTRMESCTGALSWWKCHWADLKSAGLFRRNLSPWTPLKPQHSHPYPNLFGQSTLVYWLPYSSHTFHHPSQTPCLHYASQKLMLDSCKMVEKQSKAFFTFLWHFFQVLNTILLHIVNPHVQIAFLKFTSCDNQALVRCIPIPAVAVHFNLKS